MRTPKVKLEKESIVVKVGGSILDHEPYLESLATDIALLHSTGARLLVVHGGGPQISRMMKEKGKEINFVEGLRVTDEETMEIILASLLGWVNPTITCLLNKCGARAIGLSGVDGGLVRASRHKHIRGGREVDLGFVGDVREIDSSLILKLVDTGYIPVIASVGIGEEGKPYNINADTIAAELAVAIGATRLILMTDVEGVMVNRGATPGLLTKIQVSQAQRLIEEGEIRAGMIPKVQAAIRALEGGVDRVYILNGYRRNCLLDKLFEDKEIGTDMVNG
ncbi:MAG: Acetylglutamate kinase [Actinobacteria bacterium]|nr:Acetylglutamate kinase [Actinomycetota bacterium]